MCLHLKPILHTSWYHTQCKIWSNIKFYALTKIFEPQPHLHYYIIFCGTIIVVKISFKQKIISNFCSVLLPEIPPITHTVSLLRRSHYPPPAIVCFAQHRRTAGAPDDYSLPRFDCTAAARALSWLHLDPTAALLWEMISQQNLYASCNENLCYTR